MMVTKENRINQITWLAVSVDLITLGEAINFSKFCPPNSEVLILIYAIRNCESVKRGRECRHHKF